MREVGTDPEQSVFKRALETMPATHTCSSCGTRYETWKTRCPGCGTDNPWK